MSRLRSCFLCLLCLDLTEISLFLGFHLIGRAFVCLSSVAFLSLSVANLPPLKSLNFRTFALRSRSFREGVSRLRLQSYIIFRRCANPDAIFFKIYAADACKSLSVNRIKLCKLMLIYVSYIKPLPLPYSKIRPGWSKNLPGCHKKITYPAYTDLYGIIKQCPTIHITR